MYVYRFIPSPLKFVSYNTNSNRWILAKKLQLRPIARTSVKKFDPLLCIKAVRISNFVFFFIIHYDRHEVIETHWISEREGIKKNTFLAQFPSLSNKDKKERKKEIER